MAYMTVFLKRKYDVKISESFSISIFLYLLSIFLSGLLGLGFYFAYGIDSLIFAAVSALFLLSPVFAVIAHLIMERLPAPQIRLIRKIWDFGENILRGIRQLCCDHRTVAVLLAIYAARMLNMLLLYWWIVRILHYDGIGIPALLLLNRLFPLYGLAYAQLTAELILSAAAVLVLRHLFGKLEKRVPAPEGTHKGRQEG